MARLNEVDQSAGAKFVGDSLPSGATEGDTWYRTSDHKLLKFTNGAWYDFYNQFQGLDAPTFGYPLVFSGLPQTSYCFDAAGVLWSWGRNNSGQLGTNTSGDSTNQSSPVSVVGNHSFTQAGAGFGFILATENNACWAWGYNGLGQLGDNTLNNKSSPNSVLGNRSIFQAATGGSHSLMLDFDGLVWSCGYNTYGQIGYGASGGYVASPHSVVGNHSFIQVAGGIEHSFGLKSDGSGWSWGRNTYGQLGDNSGSDRNSPVSIVGGHSFSQMGGGGDAHSVALRGDGTAWAWGFNSSGQLGDGTGTTRYSPVSVIGGHQFIQVMSQRYSCLALKEDGSVWAWGQNNTGQLGDNTITQRNSPVSVVGNHSFIQIAGGEYHSFALKSDGSVWAWGQNNYGQLGDNTTQNRSSPVSVVRVFR